MKKKKRKINQNFDFNDEVWCLDCDIIVKGIIRGIVFYYDSSDGGFLRSPKYTIEVNVGTMARHSIEKDYYDVFETKEKIVEYIFSSGIARQLFLKRGKDNE